MRDFRMVFGVIMRQRLRVMFQPKGGSKAGRVATGVVIALSFLLVAASWSVACWFMFSSLTAIGSETVGLFGVFFASMVMTLFFCFASVVGTLFASQDAELLMSLPVGQGAVFMARLAFVYAGELAVGALFSVPAVVCYAILGGGAWAILWGAVAVLLLPALPLAAATLVSLLLMRSAMFMRHREAIMTVFGVVMALTFSIGGQFIGPMMTMSEAEVSQTVGAIGAMAGAFPPAAWAAEAVAASGGMLAAALKGLLYVLACAAGLAVVGVVGARSYFKGAAAMKESAKAKPERAKLRGESMRRGSVLKACLMRETRSVMRSPTYAMNCLLGVVMFPLMFVIVPFITAAQAGENLSLPEGVNTFRMFAFMLEEVDPAIIFAGVFAIMMFTTFANIAASTAISREGESFGQVKAMPLKMSVLVFGKLIFSAAANAATVLLTAAVMVALLPNFAGQVLLAAAAGCIAGVGTAALGMLIDVLRPKLVWQNEAEAVKQNINGMFGMLLNLAMALLLGAPTVLLSIFVGFWAAALAAVAGSAVVSVVSVWWLGKAADKALIKV